MGLLCLAQASVVMTMKIVSTIYGFAVRGIMLC